MKKEMVNMCHTERHGMAKEKKRFGPKKKKIIRRKKVYLKHK